MKNYTIIAVLFACIIFESCSLPGEKVTIGVLFDSFNAPRFQKEKIYFEEKISELGGTAIIKTADGSSANQELQAKELVDKGVSALIIIACNVNTAASIVRYAQSKGVKVIAYDRLIKNCELDFFCTFDGIKVGEYLAEYAIKNHPKGNFVLLNGDKADENATMIYSGTMNVLQPKIDKGEIEVVYTAFVAGWSGENAQHISEEILEFSTKNIDAFISQYDGISGGVYNACENKGLTENMIITGQDAEVAACKRILDGEQSMTIYKPVKTMAYDCVKTSFNLIKDDIVDIDAHTDNGRKEIPTKFYKPLIVDKNNIESTVIADGFLTMNEITAYNN